MNDYINRQNAIEIFDKRREELTGIYGDLGGAMSGVVKTIKELPSAKRTMEWIPCSKRLPENEDVVLVTYANGEIGLSLYLLDSENFVGYLTVVAWMPLPKNYEKE